MKMLRIEKILDFISTNCLHSETRIPYAVVGYSHSNVGFYTKLYYNGSYPSFSKPFEKLIMIKPDTTPEALQEDIDQALRKILDDVSKYMGDDVRKVLEKRLYYQPVEKIGTLIL